MSVRAEARRFLDWLDGQAAAPEGPIGKEDGAAYLAFVKAKDAAKPLRDALNKGRAG